MAEDQIPRRTVARFPLYLRSLLKLKSLGLTTVSSQDLAEVTMNNPAQIRKDLSFMGELGTRGLGYDVDQLIVKLRDRLALDDKKSIIIIGTDLRKFPYWQLRLSEISSFQIIGLFECGEIEDTEMWIEEMPIYDIDELHDYVSVFPADIAVLISANAANQQLVDELSAFGVKAFLNFTSIPLKAPDNVVCRHVDLSSELQILSFYLSEGLDNITQLPVYEPV